MKKIILTGGGTAGHVIVNTVLIPRLIQEGWQISYIGSYKGIEREMIEQIEGVTYYGISTGKLRRYFSMENFKDIFKVLKGIKEAYQIMCKTQPQLVFSCGGFVSVPVMIAAKLKHVPSIIRETDYTVGLANRIGIPLATKVCVTFADTLRGKLPNMKRVEVGPIIREDLLKGQRKEGLKWTGLTGEKPIILIIGGSQGANKINQVVRASLEEVTRKFDVVHICGRGKVDQDISVEGYRQFEYVHEELAHFYKLADVLVSRAGSNAVCEGLLLNKPMLLIPISKKVSRGDQILNAKYIQRQGGGKLILEENLNEETFITQVNQLYENKERYIKKIDSAEAKRNIGVQLEVISAISR
ncbi:MAG: undecaprenyldiphospho-muramoylpentapeptide beta-N-acetylglucosaminyltransferase [Cellulosilyticaceae bacterium]